MVGAVQVQLEVTSVKCWRAGANQCQCRCNLAAGAGAGRHDG